MTTAPIHATKPTFVITEITVYTIYKAYNIVQKSIIITILNLFFRFYINEYISILCRNHDF